MTSKTDKRAREDLDLFLLGLIKGGIATPYRMQTAAGISQGASLQSLNRLSARKLIRATEAGPRGRVDFHLTSAGRRWLERECAGLLTADSSGDLDSVLRKGLLVAFIAGNRARAIQILREAADERLRRGSLPNAMNSQESQNEIATVYKQVRQDHATSVLKAEADVLQAIAVQLSQKTGRKR
jgi:DNA-binding PadR family transcriptional regulator